MRLTTWPGIIIDISKDLLWAIMTKNCGKWPMRRKMFVFSDLYRVCEHFLGEPRRKGTSHCVFKTPWLGDPRVNIQNDNGKARAYQVRQVVAAIRRLKEFNDGCE